MEGTRHGKMIAGQMLDVAIRVQAIRPFAVSQMVRILCPIQLPYLLCVLLNYCLNSKSFIFSFFVSYDVINSPVILILVVHLSA